MMKVAKRLLVMIAAVVATASAAGVTIHRSFCNGYPAAVADKPRPGVAATGCAGPFADTAAVQSYFNAEVRPDLNGQIFVVKNETTEEDGEMRFVCESKYGGNYTLTISIREDSSHSLWIDTTATAVD